MHEYRYNDCTLCTYTDFNKAVKSTDFNLLAKKKSETFSINT